MSLQLENVNKTFGNHQALKNINLDLSDGGLTALLGPSGCGKTTLLRILSGLEEADSGIVRINGIDQSGVSIKDRQLGFVFQHYALFRHMTVFENVAFGLRVKPKKERPEEADIRSRVHEVLGLVQLDNQSHKYPDEMSGGQRQRVALARALVINPKILLLDEPFGALDAHVRKDLRRWLRRLHDEINITSILVTHDQEEALEVADRIVVMNNGIVEQAGTPEEIYRNPKNSFVYQFLGSVNVFHGRVDGSHLVHYNTSYEQEPLKLESKAGEKLVYVRPHEFEVHSARQHVSDMEGRILRISFIGPHVRLEVDRLGGEGVFELALSISRYDSLGLGVGEVVYFHPLEFKSFQGEGI